MALTLTLNTKVLKTQASAAGEKGNEGGEIHDTGRKIANSPVLNGTTTTVTDVNGLDTAMVTMTLFFFTGQQPHGHGGGGGHVRGQPPENMTLQGANEFVGPPSQPQPRQTARAIGSVSAASHTLAMHIG